MRQIKIEAPRQATKVRPEAEASTVNLRALGRVIRTGKWTILLVTVAFMMLGYFATRSTTNTYTAEALLLLQNPSGTLTNTLSTDPAAVDTATAIEVFGSLRMFERIVDDLDLIDNPDFNPFLERPEAGQADSGFRPVASLVGAIGTLFPARTDEAAESPAISEDVIRQMTVRMLRSKVQLLAERRTNLIRVIATTEDPETSAKIANAAAEAFVQELVRTRLDSTDQLVEQLSARVVELREAVNTSRATLQDFASTATTANVGRVEALNEEAARLRSSLSERRAEAQQARDLLEQIADLSGRSGAAVTAAIRGSEALSELTVFASGASGAAQLPLMRAEVERRIERRDRLIRQLEDSLADLEENIRISSAEQLRFQQLQREADANAEIYDFALRRLNELSVQSGVETASARIAFTADIPLGPDPQRRRQIIIVLAFLGLMTGIGYVLIREATNQKIRKASDLQSVLPGIRGLPVPPAPRGLLVDETSFAERMLLKPEPTPYSEAIRRLRIAVLDDLPVNRSVVVMVASDVVSTGKTLLTIALARSWTLVGKRVLVIEADMRNASMARHLRLPAAQTGLQDVIAGLTPLSEACQQHETLGIDVLLAKKTAHNPADLLEQPGFAQLLAEAATSYDVILIDTPPVLATPDALPVSRHVNRTVFVAGYNASTVESVTEALAELPEGLLSDLDMIAIYGGKTGHEARNARMVRKLARL